MRLAFFGDVIGRTGREGLATHLPALRRRLGLEFVVVHAENAAAGFGITERTAEELFDAGADCLTLGNHSFDQREALTYIDREQRLLRPLNYPRLSQAPGRGSWMFDAPGGRRVLVMNVLGRVHMDSLDDPFSAVDEALEACPLGRAADAVIVDMHCEATSEKMAMGHFCADDSVIRLHPREAVRRFSTRLPGARGPPAGGPATICGVYVETDARTGLALRAEPIRVGGRLAAHVPEPAREPA